MDFDRMEGLAPLALQTSIYALHIGAKTDAINAGGVRTVEQLVDRMRFGATSLTEIPNVGRSAVEASARSLDALSRALTDVGSIDWDMFATELGYPLVPHKPVLDSEAFLNSFRSMVSDVIGYYDNPIDRLILTERLTKPHYEQMTLEAIAQAAQEPLTRERVRQREAKLLTAISGALLDDDHNGLEFHFRQSFASFWKQAAEAFGEQKEFSLQEFTSRLCAVWSLSTHKVMEHLPLITSILTSKARLPASLRPRRDLDPKLFGEINSELLSKPLSRFALGKSAEGLMNNGFSTLGHLIEAAKWNTLPPSSNRAGQRADTVLKAVAAGLTEEGRIDWAIYAKAIGLTVLPSRERVSPAEFLEHLNADIEDILRLNSTAARAADVFRLRTSLPKDGRPTLDQTAAKLRTYGSVIKREETELLELMHEQLIDRDFALSKVFFRSDFLARLCEAANAYNDSMQDFVRFRSAICTRWEIAPRFLDRYGAGLWSVLDLYPRGRPRASRRVKESLSSVEEFASGVIVLRGFRRAH
ncbi:hypothetical protein ABIF35_006584 [Bradyrhizobium japonicum]|uniref:hypothetical protein n=1 Tax=Bradyrhizobium diazoefficiens TaxID=1355477 RepID=UPI0034975614